MFDGGRLKDCDYSTSTVSWHRESTVNWMDFYGGFKRKANCAFWFHMNSVCECSLQGSKFSITSFSKKNLKHTRKLQTLCQSERIFNSFFSFSRFNIANLKLLPPKQKQNFNEYRSTIFEKTSSNLWRLQSCFHNWSKEKSWQTFHFTATANLKSSEEEFQF
jgi:hypothetical protein